MSPPALWHFKCSHYCEKVRWALDWKDLPHRRVSLFAGWHVPPTLILSGRQQVPLLRVDGRTIRDSTRILEALESAHPERPLYPPEGGARDRATRLENDFDRLGPAIRRVHYSLLVPHLHEATAFFANASKGPVFQLYKLTWGALLRPTMGSYLGFEPAQIEESRREIESILRHFEAEVGPSGYLVEGSFGVVDLTLASLLSTLLDPPGFPYPMPVPFPDEVLEYRASLERFDALAWTREIYEKHRPESREIL